MAGWHHWLDGRDSEWAPGVGDGQGGLACCDSWGRKESDTTEWLNWTELIRRVVMTGNSALWDICLNLSAEIESTREGKDKENLLQGQFMFEQCDRGGGLVKDIDIFSQQYFQWLLFMCSLLLSNEIFLNMLCFSTGVLLIVFPLPQMPFLHFHSIKWCLFFNASCVSFSLWPYHIFMREKEKSSTFSYEYSKFSMTI